MPFLSSFLLKKFLEYVIRIVLYSALRRGQLWHTIKKKKKETIYGHFLICYLSLFLLKVLEIKVFKKEINSYDLIRFIRDFRVVRSGDNSYINISRDQAVNEKIKGLTGMTNLDALYLTEKEVENIFSNCMLLDF